ncbi:hypothetical protein [Dyella sp. EPa41]|uniref:hypothetical protein n=1 Tax=Dyella sp. EPa41 TaxID=1561194 RepID=UPI001916C57E|nr:hypothetical protein [Dyella sp. EPa41]
MANRDHTVRVRSSVPADDTLTGPPDDLSPTGVAWPETFRRGTRADIALAVLALTRLRIDSERCRLAQVRGYAGRPLAWPLSVAEIASFGTAIQCLQQYARLLVHEAPVNPPAVQ